MTLKKVIVFACILNTVAVPLLNKAVRAADDGMDRYKTHSPFASASDRPPQNQEAGEVDNSDINPLMENDREVLQQEKELRNGMASPPTHPLAPPQDTNPVVTGRHPFGWTDTNRWQTPANESPGKPNNVPGESNTIPEDRNRAFGTFGRAIPIAPSPPKGNS